MEKNINHLHHQFQTYGKNVREWMRKCVLMLPEIERERVWEKKGYGSIHEYAGKLAGMSHKIVNDALRAMRYAEEMPAIRQVIEERGINAVRPILTMLTEDNQTFWAEKASIMSQHTLETYRREFETRERALPKNRIIPDQQAIDIPEVPVGASKKIIPMDLNPEVATKLEKLKGQGDWNTIMQELLELREKNLEESKPKAVSTDSRHIPAAIENFIIRRSRGVCEFGQCMKFYNIIHHTQRFALEPLHDPDHMVALCTEHERLAHLTLIENEEQSPQNWKIRNEPDQGLAGSSQRAKYNIDQIVQSYRKPG